MNEQTGTFTENVNYITELDHSYGKTSTLHRSNIYLADSTTYDVVTTANIYNRTTMLTEHITVTGTLTASASTVLEHMLAVKSAVESAHPLVSYTYSYSTTIFGTLDASMVSVDPNIYVRTIECKISLASIVKFDLVSTVSDAIEIIPAIAMIDHTVLDSVVAVSNNTAEVLAVANDLDNVNIAAVNIASINTVASIQNIANITTVANDLNSMDLNGIADVTVVANDLVLGAASSINIASAGKVNIDAVAANKANIDAVAANEANINAVIGSAAATAADVLLTHADVVLTHADVVAAGTQVGIATAQAGLASDSAIAAGLSEIAAHNSEVAAAASASSITGLTTTATNVAAGGASTAAYNPTTGVLSLGIPVGADGVAGATGATGNGIASVVRTSGTGSAGTTDTYTITYTDATTSTFNVYNGADGLGTGDMLKSVYDTNNSGVVDSAETVLWSGVSETPTTLSGYGITDAATSTHNHTGVYEPIDATILRDSNIGVSVQAYDANTTTAGNTFNGNNQLVRTTAEGKLPVIDGTLLTGLNTILIDDNSATATTTFSGSKIQQLHDFQAESIANLSSASGSIASSSSPVMNSIPITATDMPFSITVQSNDTNIFSFNDTTNEITFSKNGNHNFLSTVVFEMLATGSFPITFDLVDVSDSSVVKTQSAVADGTIGGVYAYPVNTLITVGSNGIPSAPLTIKLQASCGTADSVLLKSFSSILASSVGGSGTSGVTDHTLLSNIGVTTHAEIDTALSRLANTSGTNTGDETASTIKTKLGITTISGSNTGDQDLSGYSLTTHNHAGVYEPADASILKSAAIGTTVQGYSANTTTAGNTFNGVSQLVQTTAAGKLPAIDGSLLTNLPAGSDATKLPLAGGDMTGTIRGVYQAMAANDIAVSTADIFSKTISGATTLTVSSIPASPKLAIFVLELTNGGSSAVTWFANIRWDSGVAPTLTAAGLDIIVFYTRDGGANWRALVRKDSK